MNQHKITKDIVSYECVYDDSGDASSEKSDFSWRGWDFHLIFNLEGYPTNLMSRFFDNFCQLLGSQGTSPPPPGDTFE